MQQEIGRLEADIKTSALFAVSQAKLISLTQNDLQTALFQVRSIERSQLGTHDSFMKMSLQNQELQEKVNQFKAEHNTTAIDLMAQASLAATFEQACTYIRDMGTDQECTVATFKVAMLQMQEDIDALEVEKRDALVQIASQSNLIATAQSDLEEAHSRISDLARHQHEAIDSRSIIALLQEKAEKLSLENDDASERAASFASLLEIATRDLEQARLRAEDLESRLHDVTIESSTIEQMHEIIKTLEQDKQAALTDSERIREDAAAKELKSFASFYALQRLSLQNQSSKMGKCHIQNFSLNIGVNQELPTQQHPNARYRTQGVISEIGIRCRR
jgi:hypothetical protein